MEINLLRMIEFLKFVCYYDSYYVCIFVVLPLAIQWVVYIYEKVSTSYIPEGIFEGIKPNEKGQSLKL